MRDLRGIHVYLEYIVLCILVLNSAMHCIGILLVLKR